MIEDWMEAESKPKFNYGEYTLGRVVKMKNPEHLWNKVPVQGALGHIIGFKTVEYDSGDSINILVRWFNGYECSVDPREIILF